MGQKEWYFFCVRDRKYPTGLRTNRATDSGYWKATGKDKEIYRGKSLVGMKKTLVFHKGRAPKGEKTNWVMHEYRLEGKFSVQNLPKTAKNEWVICRVFQKSCGGKKTHISGLVRVGSFGNGLAPAGLPPLMESSPYNGNSKPVAQSAYVPCFSNPLDVQRNEQDNPLSNSFYSAQVVPFPSNFQFPSSVLTQDQSILRALIENHGSNMSQNFKTDRELINVSQETGLITDINNEISSVVSNLEMGKRPFDDHEGPFTSTGAMDLDCFWRY
ncbi:hypothetical protein DITRI_Ditri04bG0048100 [Diplodiscus trichospermus]